ncbi:hypothetical protein [Christiangramia sp. SM2212]|uniref:Uncharacterized protein n=1 Tax=Christiangramia sediminicola TaxID=3073267 RepID=A0ABU1ERY0_9FLAO|nr:hypothetical protein [Christiangramia sp. SM2212]MDR5590739.1 hypothetical protein [Christiangramia sp. SM2212]
MKKVIALIAILLIAFIGLIYWSVSSTDKDFQTCHIEEFEDLEKIDFSKHDSIKIAPSTLYQGDMLKTLMQGENYRKTWATPVEVPIAFLDTLKGGLKVIKEGGGKQTHSLKLMNPEGILFTLRSVTKDPKKLVPEMAETLGLENIIVDGISAQHPYGAILAAELSEIAEVMHTHPQMLFIPKQKSLSKYNEKYGNRLYLLEYETESEKNWTSFENVAEIIETKDLQELKQEKGEMVSIDRAALIRVRLFDLLIGDWDRHAEQWGWILQENEDEIKAIPLAGDRDNAFFNLSGVIPSIITNKNVEPLVRPFEAKIDYMPGLVYPFDRYFLIDTPQNTYEEQAEYLQKALTDSKIDDAFKVWPKAISELDKEDISLKIKSRRDHLKEYARSFHQIVQEKGRLTEALKGSDNAEIDENIIPCFECAGEAKK